MNGLNTTMALSNSASETSLDPSRRQFLVASTALVAGTALTGCATLQQPSQVPARRPNVVLIMSDDQGYGDLSCHGNPNLKTPNIDRLYAESTRLTQYHHSPVCTPTRASLMTGRYNYRTCAIDTYRGRAMMHPEETTIAEMLGAAGYRTGIFGKWHLGDCFPMRACDQGFQESLVHFGGGLAQPSDRPESGGYFNPVLLRNGALEKHEGYCTDIFAREAIGFMERHRTEPFFLYLATNTPHSPLIVDEKYSKPYLDMGLPAPVAKLYGMISNLDENVGRVLDALDSFALREDTIVIFTTDNGGQISPDNPRFNAGLRGAKASVYQGGIRVPFFIRWPGKFQQGADVDQLSAHIDVAPTLLTLCAVDVRNGADFDGVNLSESLTGDFRDRDRTLFFQWHRGDVPEPYTNSCVRTERYKLVNGVELYDLANDPGEERDVAAQFPEIVAAMRAAYERWFDEVSATRGYVPPSIVLGDDRANPVNLTLQDMRGGDGGGYGPGGFWKTEVARAGVYDVTIRFASEMQGGTAYFQLGGVNAQSPIQNGESVAVIKGIHFPKGPASIRAWANSQEPANGARYVDIIHVGE